MSSPKIAVYQPKKHAKNARPAPRYTGSHVVVGPIPLQDILFPRDRDDVAQFVSARNPKTCPSLANLTAQPASPPIKGAELKQQLEVRCPDRWDVIGADRVTAYPVCEKKLANLGRALISIQDEELRGETAVDIKCPFMHLGGVATGKGASVEIVVSADGPRARALRLP